MRKAYLSLLGKTPDNNDNWDVLQLPPIAHAITGTKGLRAGQVILSVCSRNDEPLAVYVLSSEGMPHQIWGTLDLLMDQVFLHDYTPLYLPSLRMSHALLHAAYDLLDIQTMIDKKVLFLELESSYLEIALKHRLDWKMCKKTLESLIDHLSIESDIKDRMYLGLKNAICPKKESLKQPLKINFLGYPGDNED